MQSICRRRKVWRCASSSSTHHTAGPTTSSSSTARPLASSRPNRPGLSLRTLSRSGTTTRPVCPTTSRSRSSRSRSLTCRPARRRASRTGSIRARARAASTRRTARRRWRRGSTITSRTAGPFAIASSTSPSSTRKGSGRRKCARSGISRSHSPKGDLAHSFRWPPAPERPTQPQTSRIDSSAMEARSESSSSSIVRTSAARH